MKENNFKIGQTYTDINNIEWRFISKKSNGKLEFMTKEGFSELFFIAKANEFFKNN